MNIIRLVDTFPSSTEEINRGLMPNIYYISKLQAEMGHHVEIHTYAKPGQPEAQTMSGIMIRRIKEPRLKRTFLGLAICKAIRDSGDLPDVVHAMNPLPLGWLVARCRQVLPARYVLSLHASIGSGQSLGGRPGIGKLYIHEFRLLARYLASEVDLVLPVSHFLKRELEWAGNDPDNLTVVPSGVDTRIFRPMNPEGSDRVRVLYVGRFSRGKGMRELLQAVDRLRGSRMSLSMIGGSAQDDYYNGVVRGVREMGLDDRVRILSPVSHSDLPSMYASHDIVVLPSIMEALGKVLLEAMACGRPVISTLAGGVPDVVEHGKNGLLVPPGDVEKLSDALETLIRDEHARRRMGKRARRRALRFDWRSVARRYSEAFASLGI